MNELIYEWEQNGISFYGIFHVHFHNVSTLSESDIAYIERIMNAMPIGINKLYFPVFCLPDAKLVPYFAERSESSVKIKKDKLIIVQGGSIYEQ